jgi:hypothetical protein
VGEQERVTVYGKIAVTLSKTNKTEVSVIIPAYIEAQTVGDLVSKIKALYPDLRSSSSMTAQQTTRQRSPKTQVPLFIAILTILAMERPLRVVFVLLQAIFWYLLMETANIIQKA